MNKNAKKWVEVLRSGQYKQGYGCLRYGDRFCCLGVACDLYAKEKRIKWKVLKDSGNLRIILKNINLLPDEVSNWLGLTSNNGRYLRNSLSGDNDCGATFDAISDIIEAHKGELFHEA